MRADLENLGWNESFQLHFDSVDHGGLVPARVIRENRGVYIVNTGEREGVARLAGSARREHTDSADYPTVGDWLAVERVPGSEEFMVRNLLPRSSLFERQAVGHASKNQSVAANFESLFLVTGLDGDFNTNRIQRYLSLAWTSRAQLVIVLNKADLRTDLPEVLREVEAIAGGVPVYAVSANDPSTLGCLRRYLSVGQTVALLGSSGVGKSSLVNAFLGERRLATQETRSGDSRGRHTTTWRELLRIPDGGLLIDLPGMRELQLTGERLGVEKAFSDIDALATQCRFRNCRHTGEPGCALDAAIKTGALDPGRYQQFVTLSVERAEAQARSAAREKAILARKRQQQDKDRAYKQRSAQKREDSDRQR